MGSLLFDRVLTLHIQFASHLVAVISKQIIVERFHVASYRTSDACSVGCEYGTYLRQFVVDIKRSQSTHPLVGVIYDLVLQRKIVVVETFYHQSCCIREHRSLVVITISVQRVYAVVLPQPSIYFILLFKERIKINQYCDWLTRNCPATYSYLKSLLLSLPLPICKERTLLLKIRTLLLFPEIWTNEDYLVLMCFL